MPRPYTRYPCGIYGPRNLVLRHGRRVKNRLLAEKHGRVADEPPLLEPGYEQLFSYYAPALDAGVYSVSVEQAISSPATSEDLAVPQPGYKPVSQKFEVVAPRFSLPDGAIHSSFPPQGHGALAKTLPHVVLADPHLPWARSASHKPDESSPDWHRNRVPWLALLVFTADELALSADQLDGPGSLFSQTTLKRPVSQTQTQAVTMKAVDLPNLASTISPVGATLSGVSDDEMTDVIFVPSKLFTELVTSYTDDGTLPHEEQRGPDISRYKYMAHVRDINTTGMAEAGVEDNGIFGVVVAHRTGPLANTQPQPVVAHLVSLEGVESESMDKNWANPLPYVAMSSLHSWNFVTLPEGSFDMKNTLQDLGLGVNVLRAPDSVINAQPMDDRLRRRLQDGFTLAKHRTATGEITAAMSDARNGSAMAWLSDSGTDLQVMDPEVGLMDITYSTAWQLGRTLAMADEVFTAALGRLRTAIHHGAMEGARAEVLRDRRAYRTREETVRSLLDTIPRLNDLHKHGRGLHAPGGSMADRWQQQPPEPLDLSYHGPLVQSLFEKHAASTCNRLMGSADGGDAQRYDEHNTPASTDWMVVLKWVLDRMFLYGIPAHYLIIDPSHLGPETLRFFHVDRNWTDALVDGALSLGKLLSGVDKVRRSIHGMIHSHLDATPPRELPVHIPTYGFLMRSAAVTHYRDLKVTVQLSGVSDTAPILRQDNLDVAKGVMLCILGQHPGHPGLESITFTQPPHQQSFIAAAELDSHHIETQYKRIFTLPDQDPNPTSWHTRQWTRPDDPSPPQPPTQAGPPQDNRIPHAQSVFKWGMQADPETRTLLFPAWAVDVNGVLNHFGAANGTDSPPLYQDDVPNAAMVGIQLNNPIYQLVIGGPAQGSGQQGDAAGGLTRGTTVAFPPVTESATVHPLSLSRAEAPERSRSGGGSTPEGGAAAGQQPPPRSAGAAAPQVGLGFELGPGHGAPRAPPPHFKALRGPLPLLRPRQIAFQGPGGASSHGKLLPGTLPRSRQAVSRGGHGGPPEYNIRCRPLDNDPQHPGIPSGDRTPKDLVFSILQRDMAPGSAYRLETVTLELRLASGPPNDASYQECLLSEYAGPGPSMLSNVRFNVLAQLTAHENASGTAEPWLALRVIPRSTKGFALPDMCREMSFVLPVCRILPYRVSSIPLRCEMQYRDEPAIVSEDGDAIQLQKQEQEQETT
ncbi:hypothetical protein SLS56_011825 [Neofusicoccum ribis]|uniref:Uncharacterized protein n=1 Tax=Neofusicoccum ribis TaxID=45134 RepID=A0ABR3SAJ0_9PEZI